MDKVKNKSASAVLKDSLRKRLHTRIKMKTAIRSGGGSQEVQTILDKFNDGDEEKADMMKDIQKDVKGMRHKDAKKYLKKVMNTMNKDEVSSFTNMVKDKIPGHQSNEIINYVKRTKTANSVPTPDMEKRETENKKPQVNPETVYVPTRLLTDEQKAEKLEKEKRVTTEKRETEKLETGTTQPKRFKSFGRVNIQVPKLADLKNHPGLPEKTVTRPSNVKTSSVKTSTMKTSNDKPGNRRAEIDALFPTEPTTDDETKQQSLAQRTRSLTFFAPNVNKFLLETAEKVDMVTIQSIEFLNVPPQLEIPGSAELVQDMDPTSIKPSDDQWIYKVLPETKHVTRIKNAYQDCIVYVKKFDNVKIWLTSLVNQRVPLQFVLTELNNLGILKQVDRETQPQTMYFRILCLEYRNSDKLSVPMVPFVKIVYQ